MTTDKILTLELANQILDEIVAEFGPDYVYRNPAFGTPGYQGPRCAYVHGDQPGCIVGHVLYRFGVPLAQLANHEGDSALDVVAAVQGASKGRAGWLLDWVQTNQDGGLPWGDAVARARGQVPE